jgi:hypothetical protein
MLAGLAILGGGLVSLGAGKALAQYTISGSPVLLDSADNSAMLPPRQTAALGDSDLVRLVDGTAPPSQIAPDAP